MCLSYTSFGGSDVSSTSKYNRSSNVSLVVSLLRFFGCNENLRCQQK